jgi:hypothetical protein
VSESDIDHRTPTVTSAHRRRRPTRVGWGTRILVGVAGVGLLALVTMTVFSGGPDGTDVRSMHTGQCYVETDVVEDHGRLIPYGKDAPCLTSSPRVVAVVELPLGAYPGVDELNQVVADRCGGEQTYVVAPTAETWPDGDRTLVCLHLP